MLCGVTATLGSNPSATATAARPQGGRAVLLCLDGVGACACVLVVPRVFLALLVCLGRAAWCARGRRPAREPSAPRAFGPARRLEARPGPAATHGHLSLAPLSSSNFARNSPVAYSNIEFVSLELQRFRAVSKSDRGELCAKFVWRWPCERVLAQPTGRSLHRGRVLWFLRCLPLHTCGAWSVVVLASSISASRSVQNSPCSVFC